MNLTQQIEKVLSDLPETRDDDQLLTLHIWNCFYSDLVHRDNDLCKYVRLKDILKLPREDHVKRIRAKIQNVDGRYLPTKIEVVHKRKQNEEKWKTMMSTEYKRL